VLHQPALAVGGGRLEGGLLGRAAAEDAARRAEYVWNDDPGNDRFAAD
jgi:hypothetical protein